MSQGHPPQFLASLLPPRTPALVLSFRPALSVEPQQSWVWTCSHLPVSLSPPHSMLFATSWGHTITAGGGEGTEARSPWESPL